MSLARRALRSGGAPCCLRCAWRPAVPSRVGSGSTSTSTSSGSRGRGSSRSVTSDTERLFSSFSAARRSEQPDEAGAATTTTTTTTTAAAAAAAYAAEQQAVRDALAGTDAETAAAVRADDADPGPRWAQTPPRMKAPFSLQQPKDPRRSVWTVNEDPARLDRMYEKLLGRDLARTLPDELKWLAVTHKSFDNGRRGFNTRLAFYGRMIVALETTRMIMGSDVDGAAAAAANADPYGRAPFAHPALAHVDKLNAVQPHDVASPARLAQLGRDVGLLGVVRWKPRLPENLAGSGVDVVLTSTLFAIVGAVSLHHGAEAANRVVAERVLRRLA